MNQTLSFNNVNNNGVGKIVPPLPVRILFPKRKDLSLIPGSQGGMREPAAKSYSLTSTYKLWNSWICKHTHIKLKINNG